MKENTGMQNLLIYTKHNPRDWGVVEKNGMRLGSIEKLYR